MLSLDHQNHGKLNVGRGDGGGGDGGEEREEWMEEEKMEEWMEEEKVEKEMEVIEVGTPLFCILC